MPIYLGLHEKLKITLNENKHCRPIQVTEQYRALNTAVSIIVSFHSCNQHEMQRLDCNITVRLVITFFHL